MLDVQRLITVQLIELIPRLPWRAKTSRNSSEPSSPLGLSLRPMWREKAEAPAVPAKAPPGPRIHAPATFYRTFQDLACERLRSVFRGPFGLAVSEGALMNNPGVDTFACGEWDQAIPDRPDHVPISGNRLSDRNMV
jgi:hypothetical protein